MNMDAGRLPSARGGPGLPWLYDIRRMEKQPMHRMFAFLAGLFLIASPMAADVRAAETGALKIVACWNIACTSTAIAPTVAAAREVGFNGLIWCSKRQDLIPPECHRQGLRCFRVIEPLHKRPGARLQMLAPGEETLPGAVPVDADSRYQYGGEPVAGRQEVLDRELVCPCDPSIVPFVREEVVKARAAGFDGVCWDCIGYRNYRSCACNTCRAALDRRRRERPGETEAQARDASAGTALEELYARLYETTKGVDTNLTVLSHCYPVFLPDVYGGARYCLDYCMMTVSWFFQPHWPLEKVRDATRRCVQGPYVDPRTVGMPMIGFYSTGVLARHRRDGARLRAELEILVQTHARAVEYCELGDILADPEARAALREGLLRLR